MKITGPAFYRTVYIFLIEQRDTDSHYTCTKNLLHFVFTKDFMHCFSNNTYIFSK